jgi:Zn finger protein HypA/HybF involved in hydrogenase expression
MARFRCRACDHEGAFEYDGRHACPRCGSPDVQFALCVEELPDDDPMIEAMRRLARGHDETGERAVKSRFRCAACGQEGEHPWDPDPAMHRCPLCGSPDLVFTLSALDLPDAIVEALLHAELRDDDDSEGD